MCPGCESNGPAKCGTETANYQGKIQAESLCESSKLWNKGLAWKASKLPLVGPQHAHNLPKMTPAKEHCRMDIGMWVSRGNVRK